MASPSFSALTSIFSLSLATLAHSALIGGIIYMGASDTSYRAESENIIYAEYIEIAEEDNDNNLLTNPTTPVKWVENTASSRTQNPNFEYAENIDISKSAHDITLFTNPDEYMIHQFIESQREGIRIASLTVIPPFPEYIQTSSPKNTSPPKSQTSQGKGKSQINRGKNQSARCSVGRATSASRPKQAAFVRISVTRSGKKSNIRLAQSSGSKRFDKAALKSARSAQCRPYIKNGIPKNSTVQIAFR